MTINPLPLPPTRMSADIAVIGGGLSGTLTAYLMGRAGYAVTLIDRHRVFPPVFRTEKLDPAHFEALRRFGLAPAISARAAAFNEVINVRKGRLVDCTHGPHHGILYQELIETIRAEMPETVRFVVGQVTGLTTGARRQRIAVLGQEEVVARFAVLATGMGDILRRDLGIARKVISPRHSIAFGFDMRLSDPDYFPPKAALTYHGEGVSDGIDHLSLFPVAGAMRANLHAYRGHGDSWVKALRERPKDTLAATFPGLARVLGNFEVPGRVDSWISDIAVVENHRQDGIVLVGDAFQTACPATGTGVSRLLTDVERLCSVYLPRWMRDNTLTAGDMAAFYDDPEKRAMDAQALEMADYRRRLAIETDLQWRVRRQYHFARRRVMHMIDAVSPALAGRLRPVEAVSSHPSLLAPD
jgi:2-polyprenyl-6-methoxyphenol hydroxylase-like FAD-dependent oxidoreductase